MKDEDLFEYVVTASAREVLEDEYDEVQASLETQGFELAANDPTVNGKPRMLLLTSWIVHEGRNNNGQVFIKEELSTRVAQGLFAPPHAGMIDFNHDFEPRGFWYKTSFAYDASAEKWGILANGAVWAWRFPEVADYVLAEMQRNGSVPVSMSAKAESVEFLETHPEAEGKESVVLHNPVFVTTSLLDVPPADPRARAVASEEPAEELAAPAERASQTNESVEAVEDNVLTAASEKEEHIMEENIQELQTKLDAAEAATLKALSTVETQVTTISDLEAAAAESTAKIVELEVALQSASDTIEGLEGDLATSNEQLAGFESEKVEAAKAAQLAERLAELPPVVMKNLEEHPEKEALLSALKEASDEQWELMKQSFALSVADSVDYVKKTEEEGTIPASGTGDKPSGLSQFIR
ncbi:MAG: hypothetical protein KOO63_12435 [Bacteroidales bacterium]|nr:hypothetical protein [Candidatus Latescibacterota bacterium]